MKIVMAGSGYVGLCSAVGFASLGHGVVCVDVDKEKVDSINQSKAPIYEKGLDKMLNEALRSGRLRAAVNYFAGA